MEATLQVPIQSHLFPNSRLAAIDIGSNACRLTIAETHDFAHLHILERVRIPLRLGNDSFSNGIFSEQTMHQTELVFKNFKKLINHYNVSYTTAYATSAMRNAKNSRTLIQRLKKTSGIPLKVIDGNVEAQTIFLGIKKNKSLVSEDCLLIDIGGGSTELTIVHREQILDMRSFPIGTVRLLQEKQKGWKELLSQSLQQMHEFLLPYHINPALSIVGTGGNLRRIGKLRQKILNKTDISFIKQKEINLIRKILKDKTPLQNSQKYKMRLERAEVLPFALEILCGILVPFSGKKIDLPNIGLADGILQLILNEQAHLN